jgi:hypothetical protein
LPEIIKRRTDMKESSKKTMGKACWAAIFFTIVGTIGNMSDLKGPDIRLSIIIICSGVLDGYLLLGLRQYSIFYKKIRGIPFIAYIALMTGKYFFPSYFFIY